MEVKTIALILIKAFPCQFYLANLTECFFSGYSQLSKLIHWSPWPLSLSSWWGHDSALTTSRVLLSYLSNFTHFQIFYFGLACKWSLHQRIITTLVAQIVSRKADLSIGSRSLAKIRSAMPRETVLFLELNDSATMPCAFNRTKVFVSLANQVGYLRWAGLW